jgi:hypothetical protein
VIDHFGTVMETNRLLGLASLCKADTIMFGRGVAPLRAV